MLPVKKESLVANRCKEKTFLRLSFVQGKSRRDIKSLSLDWLLL
jgi:hypothetical protein